MIPLTQETIFYDRIIQYSDQQLHLMIQNGAKLVLYDELILDLTKFDHPGGNKILAPFVNNLQLSIKHIFQKYKHSPYAETIVCRNTIGKLNTQTQSPSLKGKQIFDTVHQYSTFKLHQKTSSKIDFSKPIFKQINQLSVQEKQSLFDIPTQIKNYDKIKFKPTQIQQLMYTNNFWASTFCFQFFILLGIFYLIIHLQEGKSFFGFLPYLLFGAFKWTFLEYYFHRFKLHYDLNQKSEIGPHMMHHIFPQMKNILALSISNVFLYMMAFYLLYSFLFQKLTVIAILLGILIGLTVYDIAHYYFHFGPEINIPIIIQLKRNHLKHHYRDSNRGFGVSNTLWDKLLGTEHLK